MAAGSAYSLAIVSVSGSGAELLEPLTVLEPETVSEAHRTAPAPSAKAKGKKRKAGKAAKKKVRPMCGAGCRARKERRSEASEDAALAAGRALP